MNALLALALSAPAAAGSLDGTVELDALHATSTSDLPESGPQPNLSATELGVRIRGEIEQGRFGFFLDYQGREPLAGLYANSTLRLLYRAEATAELVEDDLTVGAGRFLAPTVLFMPIDGLRTTISPGHVVRIELFAGRRGITTSRREIGFSGPLLPAAGFALSTRSERAGFDLRAAYAGELVMLGTTTAPASTQYAAPHGQLGGWLRPNEALTVGASATLAQRATYLLGAVGIDPQIALLSADLFQAFGYASWRASDDVRIDLDLLRQAATLHAGPTLDATPPGPDFPVVDPTFHDIRLRGAIRAVDRAWIRPDARLRLRPDRTETRVGGGIELDRLPVEGPYLRGWLWAEDIVTDVPNMDDAALVDRLLWSTAAGYRRGSIEAELGASFVERSVAPLSARSPAATRSEDLAPFVLEAQDILFGRGFWAGRRWFAGADLEISLADPEIRAFLQVGASTEARW